MQVILRSARSPLGGHGDPLQYSCLENSSPQRSLVGYSPLGHKQSDTSEAAEHACMHARSVWGFPGGSG